MYEKLHYLFIDPNYNVQVKVFNVFTVPTISNPLFYTNNFVYYLLSSRTLLELGASPNYRDAKGLTSVYLSVAKKTDPKISEALLHDHAVLGTQDTQGWHEVHQVRLCFLILLFCFVHLGYGIAFCSIYIFFF